MRPASRPLHDLPGRRRALRAGLACAVGAAGLPVRVQAQSAYPDRPLRLIVPFAAGAITDHLGRVVAERLRLAMGQPVVVENRPGASTMLAAQQVARAAPDGHTLMVATSTTLGIAPALLRSAPIQPTSLAGVGMIGTVTHVLMLRQDFPARTVEELVAELRRRPGRYNFGSPGSGTVHHLVVETLKSRHGVFATHIPYNGSAPVMQDLMAGTLDFAVGDFASIAQIRAGRVRAIAVTGSSRSMQLPQVPALTEFDPQIGLAAWQAIVAPLGTPAPIVERLNRELNAALATPEVASGLLQMGVTPRPMSAGELDAFIRTDAKRWATVVARSGATQD